VRPAYFFTCLTPDDFTRQWGSWVKYHTISPFHMPIFEGQTVCRGYNIFSTKMTNIFSGIYCT
jgi:hypothetical protein